MPTQGLISPQNLIKQVRPEVTRSTPGFYKALVLDFFTVLSAIFVGYSYRGHLDDTGSLYVVLLASAALVIFSALQVFLTRELGHRFFVLLLETVGILFFFYDYSTQLLLISASVMIVIPFFGEILSRKELNNGLNIRFFRVSRPALAKLVTSLIIVFIILFIPHWTPGSAFISEESFSGLFDWAAVVAGNLYPDVRLNAPISELIEGVVRVQLGNDASFRDLAPDTRDGVVRDTVSRFTEALSKGAGITVSPSAPAAEIFHKYIANILKSWKDGFGEVFVFVWGVAAFITIRGLGILFHWLAAFFSFILYQILLAAGFFRIRPETRMHEVIEW